MSMHESITEDRVIEAVEADDCIGVRAVGPFAEFVADERAKQHDDQAYAFDEDHGRWATWARSVGWGRLCMDTPISFCWTAFPLIVGIWRRTLSLHRDLFSTAIL